MRGERAIKWYLQNGSEVNALCFVGVGVSLTGLSLSKQV